ncbi:hypothetical protein HK102_009308 [Quaeritorhiza haematococci]|nr:hypothetical protein HK102_009308 [Quaeritorhiza haematococci]
MIATDETHPLPSVTIVSTIDSICGSAPQLSFIAPPSPKPPASPNLPICEPISPVSPTTPTLPASSSVPELTYGPSSPVGISDPAAPLSPPAAPSAPRIRWVMPKNHNHENNKRKEQQQQLPPTPTSPVSPTISTTRYTVLGEYDNVLSGPRRKILIAVDESRNSYNAFDWAAVNLVQNDDVLVIVRVINEVDAADLFYTDEVEGTHRLPTALKKVASTLMDRYTARMKTLNPSLKDDVLVFVDVKIGDPKTIICNLVSY